MNHPHIDILNQKIPQTKVQVGNLQFLEIAALDRSIESPSKDDKFATSYGPLSSFAVGAALEIIIFFPCVQATSNYKSKGCTA